jgi:uncharacterized Zn finger protein (UPF0148 family)
MTDNDDAPVRKMAELLRQGATMLAKGCPQCNSPLLKVGEDIYCAHCNRRIVYAQEGDDTEVTDGQVVKILLPELKSTLINKLEALNQVIETETDTESLTRLANLMVLLLQALEKLEKMSG